MPTYQYVCTECGEQSEVVQKFTDDPRTVCVACGGRLRKVFSPVGIVFKGTGFYRTDSRAAAKELAGAARRNGSDAGARPSGDSGSGGESKAAANGSSSDGSSANGSSAAKAGANGSSARSKSSAKVA